MTRAEVDALPVCGGCGMPTKFLTYAVPTLTGRLSRQCSRSCNSNVNLFEWSRRMARERLAELIRVPVGELAVYELGEW